MDSLSISIRRVGDELRTCLICGALKLERFNDRSKRSPDNSFASDLLEFFLVVAICDISLIFSTVN